MVFNIDPASFAGAAGFAGAAAPYRALLGVGGIGSGSFFALDGDLTLGREESRSGRFLDRRDYCKLHIISHYVKTLLGPAFAVYPIGRVGDDIANGVGAPGSQLVKEMGAAGLDLRYVRVCPGEQTLFSFCFLYPDGSGGNLTTADSACSRLEPGEVRQAEPEFARYAGRGIALAAPEVPLAARRELLALGTQYGFFRAASFTRAELAPALESGMLSKMLHEVDLLALNLEEAGAAAGVDAGDQPPLRVVESAVRVLAAAYPALRLSITAGKRGSWTWDGQTLRHVPVFPVEVVTTAGAGDAHLAGILAGVACGLPLHQAHEAGALLAGFSVTSPHTIHPDVTRAALRELASRAPFPLSREVKGMLE